MTRLFPLPRPPFAEYMQARSLWEGSAWPASWIADPAGMAAPGVWMFRLRFALAEDAHVVLHVTADERYELALDGRRLGRGPETGDEEHTFYESFHGELAAGEHQFTALVWAAGDAAPLSKISVRPGFLLAADAPHTEMLSTGLAAWEVEKVSGYEWLQQDVPFDGFPGQRQRLDGRALAWEPSEIGGGVRASVVANAPATVRHPAGLSVRRLLEPAMLPPMRSGDCPRQGWSLAGAGVLADAAEPWGPAADDAGIVGEWEKLLHAGTPVKVPARTRWRVLVDLGDYLCAYPTLTLSGGAGATVRLGWAEALFEHAAEDSPRVSLKGHRAEVAGKYFRGFEDHFIVGGGDTPRRYTPLNWQTGRFIQWLIETGDEPLTVAGFELEETRFPTALTTDLAVEHPGWPEVRSMMERTLAVNSHDGYFDCPYYERLSYIADNRTTALVSYAMGGGDLLARKALRMFASNVLPDGTIASRHPCRHRQSIPPFSLAWTLMLADFALWRGDLDFVRALVPTARRILDAFLLRRNSRGLVSAPPGWNFTDWVPAWSNGVPPGGNGVSGVLNWLLVHALDRQAALEGWLGEGELHRRWDRLAGELADAAWGAFYCQEKGLLADDSERRHFSQHTQAYALLSGRVPPDRRGALAEALLADRSLTQATLFFRHFVIEALAGQGMAREAWRLLDLWFDLPGQGFLTTPEQPDPARSDCHVWSTHPLYHVVATWAGIRPLSPGGGTVAVTPAAPPGVALRVRLDLPAGRVECEQPGDGGAARVEVSEGITLVRE